jgi:hypothetical protein
MNIVKKLLSPSALAAVLLCAGLAATSVTQTACVGRVGYRGAVVVRSEPPPPRRVYVEPRAGYVWIDGRWVWDDYSAEWVWYDGYWVPEQRGYYYVAGRWDYRGDRYVWVQPRWVSRADANVQIRVHDHSRPTKVRIRANSGHRVPGPPR